MNDAAFTIIGVIVGSVTSGGVSYFLWSKEDARRRWVEINTTIYAAQEAMYEAIDLVRDLSSDPDLKIEDRRDLQRQLRRQVNRFLILNMRLGENAKDRGASISQTVHEIEQATIAGDHGTMDIVYERLVDAAIAVNDEYLEMAQRS